MKGNFVGILTHDEKLPPTFSQYKFTHFNERLGKIQLPKVQVFSISERLTVKTSIFLYIFTPNLSPSYNVLELKHVLE